MSSHKKSKTQIPFQKLPQQSQIKLKLWTNIDLQIEKKHKELKELKQKQEKVEQILLNELNNLSINDYKIVLDKFKFQVKKEKTYSTLSFKYLESELPKIIKNPLQVKQICQFLRQQRQVKINNIIDRSTTKNK